ncbi:MAG: sensor histidine kinase [Culicoidibacterales bacterium]
MTGWTYLKDKAGFLALQAVSFSVVVLVLAIWQLPLILHVVIAIVWFWPLLSYFVYDYWRTRVFYQETTRLVTTLDQAYLLPVVMKKPRFLAGKLVYSWLQVANQAMHEAVKRGEMANNEYQAYVTTWVHEVKTPLAALQLMVHHVEPTKRTELKKQLQAVDGYVEQALYYVKSNQLNEDYHVKKFAVEGVIRQAIQAQALMLRAKNMQVVLAEQQTDVRSDPKWVQFIFQQIIQNAQQYSQPETTVTITVTTVEEAVIVSFCDQGIGIRAHELKHVFQKGYVGSNGREFAKSTGIGLYICQRLAAKLHLRLEMSSTVGVGTQVQVIFPNGTHHRLSE